MFLLDLLYETLLIKIGEMLVRILKEFRMEKVKNTWKRQKSSEMLKNYNWNFNKNSDRNNRLLQIYLKILVLLQKHYQPTLATHRALNCKAKILCLLCLRPLKWLPKDCNSISSSLPESRNFHQYYRKVASTSPSRLEAHSDLLWRWNFIFKKKLFSIL